MRKKRIIILLLVGLVPLLWLIDDLPYTLDVTAKIYPAKKWVLQKDTDGSLSSTLYKYREGVTSDVRSYKLDNGDVAHVELIPKSTSDVYIKENDTVAFLHSALIDERIALVKSQLEELQAYFQVEQTGQKQSEVEQQKEQLIYAQQQLELETENHKRAKLLYTEGAIAPAEYLLAEAAYKLAQTQVNISMKAAEAASTGVKPEQAKYNLARIATAKKELAALQRQKRTHTLVTPISGKADFNVVPEEVIVIEDTSSYILHFPVKLSDRIYLTSSAKITVSYPIGSEPMQGELIDISDKVEYMAGEQLVFAKALLPRKAEEISSGMFLRCQIECDNITLLEYLKRILKQSMR